jgi:Type II secretion system (T2SS), protein M subtype b
MRTLSKREERAVAVLILLVIIAMTQLLLIAPVIDAIAERAQRRDALERQFLSQQRLSATIPRLRRQAQQRQEDVQLFAIMAPDPAAASALLQERLERTLNATGAQLRGMEDVAQGAVRLSARLTMIQLAALLGKLQSEPPYLVITSLSVNADQASISRKLEPMDVTVEVSIPTIRASAR